MPTPEREAGALIEALRRDDGCGVPLDRAGPALIGPTCTRSAVLSHLRSLFEASSADDTIVIYFAGHGIAAADNFYLCTADTKEGDLAGSAVSGGDIGELIEAAQCRGILLLLDCCFSAAAAEHAPAAFRSLRSGEFRLLLASARAGQRSWETADGFGTHFSTSLVEILEGRRVVGRGDGAIYFSDLIEGLNAGIAEKRAEANLPPQDMVFAGTYTSDPLVFVMRGQTLESVRFATARYSPRQLRRIVARSLLTVLALIFFCLVSWYGIIDATEYVDEEGGRLVAYRGHPHYSLPGYPQHIWTYAYGSERLAPGANRQLPLVAPIGKPVAPLVAERLDPLVAASQRVAAGDIESASKLTQDLLARPDVPFETQLGARLLLTEIAGAEQVPLLVRWTLDQRAEIRLAAVRGLFRLDPRRAVDRALTDLSGGGTGLDHSDILRRLQGTCTPDIERYLRRVADVPGTRPSPTLVVDTAVRVGCRLDDRFLLSLITRIQYRDAASIAGYAVWAGLSETPAASSPKVELWRRLLLQAHLPTFPCDPSWSDVLRSKQASEVLPAALAIARHCPGARLQIRWNNIPGLIRLTVEQQGRAPQDVNGLFAPSGGVALFAELVPLIARSIDQDVERVRGAIELSSDSSLRVAMLELLTIWGDRKGLFTSLLDANSIELRKAYADHVRLAETTRLADELSARIGHNDAFYTSLLGRIELLPLTRSRLELMLRGTREERRAAACVLAMQAPVRTAITVLTDPDGDIRSEAADCVSYNADAEAIVAELPKSVGLFPVEGFAAIQQQVRLKSGFQAHLAALPDEQRSWRLAIADTTPGSFGLWGKGMRDWFEEQRYRSLAGIR
ncbi:hypothetical protein BST63_16470 [Bradyrhizobium canariense]|uniref:Peptidase C14 caspase domain-containing protein n=1 Tax=Bradyrhizobium canariense TaxID=255045 RepID=A0ABX3X2Z9_9BRAD|nr:hypothetical protein BSR47_21015 [Bradyrhizobium canariense]OSJ28750.1 hypothetical protein BST63_16470 [Bradyrhizobium canariense]